MLFCTLTYLIFLPLVFIIYWTMRTSRQQNYILITASLVFYGWWSWEFLLLMLATCLINYAIVRQIQITNKHRRMLLWSAMLVDFGILGIFKYLNFFIQNAKEALSCIGINADYPTLHLVLPVGISFYTFQLAGYVIDRYRESISGTTTPKKESLLEFLTFICFFPQLVAGPIERASHLLPQFQTEKRFCFDNAREGMRLILWGTAKKMLLADLCAPMVNHVWDNLPTASVTDLWLGALFFTFQIYGDFSGYSDIAIGSARLFGIELNRNFCLPYFSTDIQTFWRRWHMTLMSWFRDYVYIPLGGSRCSRLRHRFNVLAVFALSGLWHGANWTFLAWGVYHGIAMIGYGLWVKGYRLKVKGYGLKVMGYRNLQLSTFLIVMLGWIIFRSACIGDAFTYITGMFSPIRGFALDVGRLPLAIIALFMIVEWFMGTERLHPFCWKDTGVLSHQWVRLQIYAMLFLAILIFGGVQTPFIYFQF